MHGAVERRDQASVDPRADQFSLAVIAYEMLDRSELQAEPQPGFWLADALRRLGRIPEALELTLSVTNQSDAAVPMGQMDAA